MQFKDLRGVALRLPEVGLGTYQYQGTAEVIREAVCLGANFLDTAESYGTEKVVGEAISGIRSQVFLATKVSPKNFRYADVLRSADKSLRQLRTDYIDLYQLHWPNYTVPIAETMEALEQLVINGKVRFIGVSNFSIAEIKRAQCALRKCRIIANQVRYNLVDRTIESGLLDFCYANDIAIIAHSPLSNGLGALRARDPKRLLDLLADKYGKTAAQIALNWCISKRGVVAIPKSSSLDRIRENCNASDWLMSSEDIKLLEANIKWYRRGPVWQNLRRLAKYSAQRIGKGLE